MYKKSRQCIIKGRECIRKGRECIRKVDNVL